MSNKQYTLIAYKEDYYSRCGDMESSFFSFSKRISEEELKRQIKSISDENITSYSNIEVIVMNNDNVIYDEINNDEDWEDEKTNPNLNRMVQDMSNKIKNWREERFQERAKEKEEREKRQLSEIAAKAELKKKKDQEAELAKYIELKQKYG